MRCLFVSFFSSFIFISWRLITLQHCSGFCHTLTWISHGFTCVPHPEPPSHLHPPSPSPPSGSSECTSPEHLSHASNLDWRSVSHLIIYMFRCCSLRSSHPRLLPQSPKADFWTFSLFCEGKGEADFYLVSLVPASTGSLAEGSAAFILQHVGGGRGFHLPNSKLVFLLKIHIPSKHAT